MTEPPNAAFKLGARSIGALAFIALVVAAAAAAFAYTAGWFSPDRLTPEKIVEALSRRGGKPRGHPRNHAKGGCFSWGFAANGAGTRLSTAPMLAASPYPRMCRFALHVSAPDAPHAP